MKIANDVRWLASARAAELVKSQSRKMSRAAQYAGESEPNPV